MLQNFTIGMKNRQMNSISHQGQADVPRLGSNVVQVGEQSRAVFETTRAQVKHSTERK